MKDDLTTVLRGMDPADPHASAASDRAQRDLTTILATRRDDERVVSAGRPNTDRRRWGARHPALVLAAAATVLAVGVAVPVLTPGPAWAGWTTQPQQASVPIARDAEQQCQDFWASVGPIEPEPEEPIGFTDPTRMKAALTERRGPWTFTILRGPEGQLGDCLFQQQPSFLRWGNGSGGGSMSGPAPAADPTGSDVDQAILGAVGGSRRTLGPLTWGDDSSMVYTYGRAGEDVASVVIHTEEHGAVTASVQNGIWAAWWPSGSEPTMPFDHLRATVTATDGSAREVDLATLGWDHSEEE